MYTSSSVALSDMLAAFGVVLGGAVLIAGLITLAVNIVLIVAKWKIFEKASEPGWAAIVPFYNSYVLAKITWGNGWFFIFPVVCAIATGLADDISWLFLLLSMTYLAFTYLKLSRSFGHGIGFAIGLYFLGIVFFPLLGFGKDQYIGVPQDIFSLKK